jgi:hypothetical protein
MAVPTITRYQGAVGVSVAYASTSTPALSAPEGVELNVVYAQLTGAMTINATFPGLLQFQRVNFFFSTDGTQRIVTFGTGFVSSGTVTIGASKDAVVSGIFDGTNVRITNREIQA